MSKLLAVAARFLLLCSVLLALPAVAAPSVTLDPTSGPVNTKVIATGSGFTAGNKVVDVIWDNTYLTETRTDDLGNFSVSFNVPQDAALGDHQVFSNGGSFGQASAIFTVTTATTGTPTSPTTGQSQQTSNTASNCSATVPTPIPSPPGCPVQGLTKDEKDLARKVGATGAIIGSGVTLSSVTGLICGPGAPVCVSAIEITGWLFSAANMLLSEYASSDPADPNFTVIAQPMIPQVAPIVAQRPITPALADALNTLNANSLKAIAYGQAAITAGNRAQGAANAGNAHWEAAQFQAEQSYSNTLASLIQAAPNLLAHLQDAWIAGGYGTVTITATDVFTNESAIAQNGVPASVAQILIQAGVDNATITLLKKFIVGMDVNKVAGTFPARLTDPSFVSAVQNFVNSIHKPVFVYPVDGQTLDYQGSYLFKVEPMADAQGFLFGFFQNGVMVWENWRDEGALSSNEYGIQTGTTAHSKFVPGSVQVWVRALINGQWTDATIITIYLK